MMFHLGSENEHLVRRMQEVVASDTVSHAYIVEGPLPQERLQFAKSFAKGILCPKRTGDNCGECPICDKIDHGNHEDLVFVEREDGKMSLGIDMIRKMQTRIGVKPNGPRYIVIIEEGDLLTEIAQNSLLKTLEEPPAGAVLMLLTENTENFLPTIRSRCVYCRIEGAEEIREESLYQQADELIAMAAGGAPYYRMKKMLGGAASGKEEAIRLIDCMEERYRRQLLSRDEKGIPCSAERISVCVDALEKARRQLTSGMTTSYVMRRLLLIIGG